MIEFFEARNSDAALRFAEHATRLRASDPTAWQVRALILSVKGRDEEAIQAVLRAVALDPASGDIRWDHVWYLYITGAYRGALAEAEQAEMLAGPYPLYRALIEDALGRPMNAFTSWVSRQRHHGMSQATAEALLSTARQRGLREGYRALINAIPAARPESGVPLAILQMKAGYPEAAVEALNSPVMARDRWMSLFLDRIPPLAPLRSDPRLAGVYARVEDFRDAG
jgi:tetratricopeptide (TPR) repeat protein